MKGKVHGVGVVDSVEVEVEEVSVVVAVEEVAVVVVVVVEPLSIVTK